PLKDSTYSGVIGGDSVYIAMKKLGFREPVLSEVSEKLGKQIDLKKLWDTDEFRLLTGPDGGFERLELKHRSAVYTVEKTASDYASAQASGWTLERAKAASKKEPAAEEKPAPEKTAAKPEPAQPEKPAAPPEAKPQAATPLPAVENKPSVPAEEKPAPKPLKVIAQTPAAKPLTIAQTPAPKPVPVPQIPAIAPTQVPQLPAAKPATLPQTAPQALTPQTAPAKPVAAAKPATPAPETTATTAPKPEQKTLPAPSVLATPPVTQTPAPAPEPRPEAPAVNTETELVGSSSPYMILKRLGGYREPLLSEVIDRLSTMLDQKKVWDEDICRLERAQDGSFVSFTLAHAGNLYTISKNAEGKFISEKSKGALKLLPKQAVAPAEKTPEAKPQPAAEKPAAVEKAQATPAKTGEKPQTAEKPEAKPQTAPVEEKSADKPAEQTAANLKIQRGSLDDKSLYIALRERGLKEPALSFISEAIDKVVDQKKLWDNDKYVLALHESGEFAYTQLQHGATVYTVVRTAPGKYEPSLERGKLGSVTPPAVQAEQPKPQSAPSEKPAPKMEPKAEPQAPVKPAAAPAAKQPEPAKPATAQPPAPAKPQPEKAAEKPASGKLGNKSLYIIMRDRGFREPVLSSVTETLGKAVNQKKLGPKDTYALETDAAGTLVSVSLTHKGKTYVARKAARGYELVKETQSAPEAAKPTPPAKQPAPKQEAKPAPAPKPVPAKPVPASKPA
ncbi:MAG TPA: hypothetical protein PLL10_04790, partial [Elusimicrobiales bacterium]|nr:hypothetical protein [Elusimicrobiales bacterium]